MREKSGTTNGSAARPAPVAEFPGLAPSPLSVPDPKRELIAPDPFEGDLGRWMEPSEDRQAEEDRQPAGPEWVETPSSKRVLAALGFAQREGDIVVVHGGTGVGKTAVARRYASLREDVWIAVMSPATNRLRPCLEQVAEACGLPGLWGGAYRIEAELSGRLRGTRGLLVIDEAQHLGHPQLEALRGLHDATGCGLALLGNDRFGRRISSAPEFAALASRVGGRVHLPEVTVLNFCLFR